MPAAQLEIVTAPHATVAEAAARSSRRPAPTLAAAVAAGFRLAGAGAHPFASGLGPLNPGAALRGDRGRVRARRPPPARLRPARPRRRPRRRPRARRLQRAALVPAGARRAGRQRAVLRGPRQRPGLGPLADLRPAAAPGRAARARRAGRPTPRRCAGAAFDDPRQWWWELRLHPRVRHGRGARAGHAGDGRGDRGGRRGRARARARAWPSATSRRGLPVAESWRIDQNRWSACRHGARGRDDRPRDRRAPPHARAPRGAARRRLELGVAMRARWRRRRAPAGGRRRARPARPRRRGWPTASLGRVHPRTPLGRPSDRPARAPRGRQRARCSTRSPGPSRRCPPRREPDGDEDLQLALYLCYELHYRGLPGVDDRWEWEPSLLALRAELERAVRGDAARATSRCRRAAARWTSRCARSRTPTTRRRSRRYLERDGTLEQFLEFVVHRSAYQLKEADPHSWALPRLSGGPKAALVEIQADEYGGGDPRPHPRRSSSPTRWTRSGSTRRYGAYVDRIPAVTLATVNLMSMFGLHRRLLGAIVGHLALFEMTSSIPNRRYADGLRRLGVARGDRRSSTSTSSPTPCTRTSRRSTSPAASPSRTRAGARHPVGRRGARSSSRGASRATCSTAGRRPQLAAPPYRASSSRRRKRCVSGCSGALSTARARRARARGPRAGSRPRRRRRARSPSRAWRSASSCPRP